MFCEGRGEVPDGGAALTFMMLGFDPQKGGYVGTWIGSMTSFLWIYRGTLDRAEKTLTLDTEGPNFDREGLARFQDIIEIKSDDYRLLRSQRLGKDGNWCQFMTAYYRRQM